MVREVDHDDTLVVTSIFAEDKVQSSSILNDAKPPTNRSSNETEYQSDEGEM